MSAIAVDRVTKRFALAGNPEGVLALSELSLAIAPGEFVAVLVRGTKGELGLLEIGALRITVGGHLVERRLELRVLILRHTACRNQGKKQGKR